MRTLHSDRHTGYVRLSGNSNDYGGFILLQDGQVVEAVASNTTVTQGETAFLHIRRHMDKGDGLLDVVELDRDVVEALVRLFTGAPLFVGLLGRFINVDALLEYLEEEKLDGSVIFSTERDLGVILLSGGGVLGSYSTTQRTMAKTVEPAARLAADKASRIEVKGRATQVTSIDIESALSLPY